MTAFDPKRTSGSISREHKKKTSSSDRRQWHTSARHAAALLDSVSEFTGIIHLEHIIQPDFGAFENPTQSRIVGVVINRLWCGRATSWSLELFHYRFGRVAEFAQQT